MKNLIIVFHFLLTLLLVGCADKGVYVGEKKDGKRHGQGTLTFSDGSSYEGEYRNDKRHGQGTLTKPNGDKYVGEFKDGEMTSQGTYTHSDGSSYEGEWKDGKQDGWGIETYSDGSSYEGEWKDGYRTGQGAFFTTFGFIFEYNIHSSLPKDWVNEFYLVMTNLDKVIPVKPTKGNIIKSSYFGSLDIYTWNSSTDKPFKNIIGNETGASMSGNERGRYMVLEIPADEFKYNDIHRYSVIPHEYFHAFQLSLSKNFYNNYFKIKWLSEGAAASLESLYTQQYYNINYFKMDQNRVNIAVVNNPAIFESYHLSSGKDSNYSSSVFMVLALVKELKKLDFTEEKAFKLIFNDFWRKNPNNYNWKIVFRDVFKINLENFYQNLSNYTNDIYSVLPSESIKLENIFSD